MAGVSSRVSVRVRVASPGVMARVQVPNGVVRVARSVEDASEGVSTEPGLGGAGEGGAGGEGEGGAVGVAVLAVEGDGEAAVGSSRRA